MNIYLLRVGILLLGVPIFCLFFSSHCPHFSSDASRDFSSGSSVLISTLQSMPSAAFSLPSTSPSLSLPLSQAPASAPLPPPDFTAPLLPFSSYPQASSVSSALSAALARPPLLLSGLSSSSALPTSSSLSSGVHLGFAAVANPVALSAVPVSTPALSASLFRPFDVPSAPHSVAGSVSAPLGSASLSLPSGGAPLLSASALVSSTAFPVAPPSSEAPHPSSFHSFMHGPSSEALPRSSFHFANDAGFDPDLGGPTAPGPEAPLPPSVPDSFRAEIRRMYAYVVSLFPQAAGAPSAPPPLRALFEDFFSTSSSPHQPVYLAWFEWVRNALAETDSRLVSLLAAGRADSSIIPQRLSHYAVHGELAAGNAVPVNPSLLSMFERSLRPSLQLGISLREAALLESSSRFHSEAL